MTGYELLQKVRSDPAHTHVPFIMVTAESKTDNVIAAGKAGVNNYIVKPFNAAMLKAKIDARPRRREAHQVSVAIVPIGGLTPYSSSSSDNVSGSSGMPERSSGCSRSR